jgi:tRNA (cmo5U34)-methyltransferase
MFVEQINYYMVNVQKILFIASELHKRGYEKLHVVPSIAPTGLAWRCRFVVPYNGKNLSFFACSWIEEFINDKNIEIKLSIQVLSDLFEKEHTDFLAKCCGENHEYVEWFSDMLSKLQEGELPYAFADFPTLDGFWETTSDNKIKTLPDESEYYIMDRIEHIKNHFEEEAEVFDKTILKLIPHYNEMIDALILSIPFNQNERINVIDLGCGTGTVARKIRDSFPKSKISCLDISKNMIILARKKLDGYVDCHINDFYNFEFDKKYDVIVSSLALHHLANDEDKKMFYKKIYNALNSNGVFYNADVVLGSSDRLQDLYLTKWKAFMSKTVSLDEIENKWMVNYRTEDRPTRLINHINWLKDIGFDDVDVVWKYYNFAVYGGRKI